MAKKYTYSRSFGDETFTAVEFDSFDEARKAVDKGIYERQLELKTPNSTSTDLLGVESGTRLARKESKSNAATPKSEATPAEDPSADKEVPKTLEEVKK